MGLLRVTHPYMEIMYLCRMGEAQRTHHLPLSPSQRGIKGEVMGSKDSLNPPTY